jgi:copper chaperone CopZ
MLGRVRDLTGEMRMSVRSEYTVVGMTCDHCVSAVTGELTALPGVREVQVDLATGTVTVASDAPLPLDEVRGAVDEAGYRLG